jgi:hypothetical protein
MQGAVAQGLTAEQQMRLLAAEDTQGERTPAQLAAS